MFREKIAAIKSEFISYTRGERLAILFAMICGFCITCEYSITKPTSNSIFITHNTVKLLPYAWLLTVPLNLLVVSLYNRFLPLIGCFRLFLVTVGITIGINTISATFMSEMPILSFILYIWKDIYVLLMFQQLWSVIHAVTAMSRAKYLYGMIFAIGGLGSVFGSTVPSLLAVRMGSERLLFMIFPIYTLFIIAYFLLLKNSGFLRSHQEEGKLRLGLQNKAHGFKLIQTSSILKCILFIVVMMQVCATVMEYQFNTYLAAQIPDQDLRTEFCGRLWWLINSLTFVFQFLASFFLVQFLGIKRSHLMVPAVLFMNAIAYLLRPSFGMITYSFTMIKTFDYSIFSAVKEMLYVPLKTDEKFKAKAVIDVFAYRTAKAFASLLVIALQIISPSFLPHAFSWAHVFLFVIWIAYVALFLREDVSIVPEPNPE